MQTNELAVQLPNTVSKWLYAEAKKHGISVQTLARAALRHVMEQDSKFYEKRK